jgi:superfamily I DNA/RNA helicase
MRRALPAMLAVLLAAGPAFAADPDLVGTWSGPRERIARDDGFTAGIARLVVTEQQGRTFRGALVREYQESEAIEETLWGAFSPDGNLIVGADEEGTYAFRLVDADTLDYCYTEAGPAARAVCARLVREE